MSDEVEILRMMYQVQVTRSEHYENQRAILTNLVLTLASALVALATFDGSVADHDQETGLLMFLIGVFGFVASTQAGCAGDVHSGISSSSA